MKRLALVAAVLVLAACAKKDDTGMVDTSAPAMAPAPAMMDSMAVRDSIVRDSVRKDSIAKAAAKKK
jgi:uncharacterized lipoprotein YajG